MVKLQSRNSYCSIEHLKEATSEWIVAIVVKICMWLSQGTQTKIRKGQVRLGREDRSYDKINREPAYK